MGVAVDHGHRNWRVRLVDDVRLEAFGGNGRALQFVGCLPLASHPTFARRHEDI
jgi:hypothetical protein